MTYLRYYDLRPIWKALNSLATLIGLAICLFQAIACTATRTLIPDPPAALRANAEYSVELQPGFYHQLVIELEISQTRVDARNASIAYAPRRASVSSPAHLVRVTDGPNILAEYYISNPLTADVNGKRVLLTHARTFVLSPIVDRGRIEITPIPGKADVHSITWTADVAPFAINACRTTKKVIRACQRIMDGRE